MKTGRKKGCIPWNKGKTGLQIAWNKGVAHSEETKKKISVSLTGRKATIKTKRILSKAQKGRKHTQATKDKIGIGNKGKTYSNETKKKISDAKKGKKLSKDHKKKISEAGKGRKWKDKQRAIMIKRFSGKNNPMYGKLGINNPNYGRKISDETRKKMRISAIKRIEKNKGQINPQYNNNACIFFDELNNILSLNGKHARNGGEYHIKGLGYWVDYYEPDFNIVIEWDENYHYYGDGELKRKDIIRQSEIENYLNCSFIRIRENQANINKIIKIIKGII